MAGRARFGVAAILAGAVLLTACSNSDSEAGSKSTTTASADSVNCQDGARTTSNLQPALRQLSDSLTAVGPASERNDLTAVLDNLSTARQAADQLSGGLGAAANAMTQPSLIYTDFRTAADSGAGLRDMLTGLHDTLQAGRVQEDQSPQLQSAVTAFNSSVERLSLACSNYFSAATVEPTTTTPRPTRTTR